MTGECGDQLFGSMALFERRYHKNLEIVFDHFHPNYIPHLTKLLNKSPVPTNSFNDVLWWLNFTTKWNEVCYRCMLACETKEQIKTIEHFYNTEKFQEWAIKTTDNRQFIEPIEYKMSLKEYIQTYTHDLYYTTSKVKIGSLQSGIGRTLAITETDVPVYYGETSLRYDKLINKYGYVNLKKFLK